MAEMFKNKRIIFLKGEQVKFFESAKNKMSVSFIELAKILKVSARTLSDWKREKFCMPFETARILSKKSGIEIPKDVKIVDKFRHVSMAAKLGGIAVYKKYGKIGGDEKYRKEKWFEWWEKKGKFIDNEIFKRKTIKKPKKSAELAEFVGIILGDGGISARQIRITLNSESDYEYSLYVGGLIENLFGIKPSVYKKKKFSAIDISVSRTDMVEFCQSLGLKIGNKVKQQIDIPDWIKKNKSFQVACIRGLIDTDGSVFTHRYKSGRNIYSYKKMDFGSASISLRNSVCKIMNDCGINSRIAKNRTVRIDSIEGINKYFAIISSNNPKHLKRYKI